MFGGITLGRGLTMIKSGAIAMETFLSNLMGVAQKRDFYKLSELTENDIIIINKTAIEITKNEMLREANKGGLMHFKCCSQ